MGLVWLHALSDILIWLAYLMIPLVLAFFAWRRRTLPFHGLFFLFSLFIFSCGFSHLLDALMFQVPVYRLFGLVKAITAVASWATLLAMIPIIPQALDRFRTQDRLATLEPPAGSTVALSPTEPPLAARYGMALATMVLAVGIRWALSHLGQQALFLPLILSVVISSWYGGIGPGLVAAVSGVIAGLAIGTPLISPTEAGFLHQLFSVGIFSVAAAAVLLITESQRAAHREALDSNDLLRLKRRELELEIQQRRAVEEALLTREQELARQTRELERERRQTAESLATLDSFIRHAPVGLMLLDTRQHLLRLNRVLATMLDSPQEGHLSEIPRHALPVLADQIDHATQRVLGTQKPVTDQVVRGEDQDRHDEERVWLVSAFPIRVPDETQIGVGSIVQEITERVRAEALVRESENRFRTLAESVPQLVWTACADGTTNYFNQQWYDYTGQDTDTDVTTCWIDVIHPEDLQRTLATWQRAVRDGMSYNIEYRFRRHDGEYRWFLGRATPEFGTTGAVRRWFGTCTDIHDLKHAQDALRESQERFRVLAEEIPQMVWTATADGDVDYLNQRWLDYTGLTVEEARGNGWVQIIHPVDLEKALQTWNHARRTGSPLKAEQRLRGRDGIYRWHLVRGIPLRDEEGRITHWVGSTTNIDEQHQQAELLERLVAERTQELRRSNQELEQFASIASHDLQEPLRKIQAFGDRLKNACGAQLDDRGLEYLERMLSSTGRLRKLIEDLLEFSRVTTKARPFAPINLNEIVREVISDLEPLMQSTNGEIVKHRLPTEFYADASQMRQLFLNLLGNALKFHRPGVTPRVDISASERIVNTSPHVSRRIEIRVSDNGLGFESQYSERIFKLFERLHGRLQYHGTGMGLAICRKIVERHGGQIRAEGRPDEGATFVIDLPFLPEPPQEPRDVRSGPQTGDNPGGG